MDTNRLKRFAVEARNILMQGVKNRLQAIGFDLKTGIPAEMPQKMYNPQNEAFLHSRTSRAISQNETYRRNTPYPPLKNRPAYAGIHIL